MDPTGASTAAKGAIWRFGEGRPDRGDHDADPDIIAVADRLTVASPISFMFR
jgi:hypothetical protein